MKESGKRGVGGGKVLTENTLLVAERSPTATGS